MKDIGRYRKLYPRIWRHPGFQKLTKSARELALYLLSGPQTSRIGLFHFSVATAAEDLNVGVETLRKGLADVAVTFAWQFDSGARVFYIPSWWRWNTPENENVLKGNLKDLNEIAPCGLVDAFALNLQTLPETLRATFIECCRIRLPEPSPIQEHKQEARARAGARTRAGENAEPASSRSLVVPADVLDCARETLRLYRNETLESQEDALHDLARHRKLARFDGRTAKEALLIASREPARAVAEVH